MMAFVTPGSISTKHPQRGNACESHCRASLSTNNDYHLCCISIFFFILLSDHQIVQHRGLNLLLVRICRPHFVIIRFLLAIYTSKSEPLRSSIRYILKRAFIVALRLTFVHSFCQLKIFATSVFLLLIHSTSVILLIVEPPMQVTFNYFDTVAWDEKRGSILKVRNCILLIAWWESCHKSENALT